MAEEETTETSRTAIEDERTKDSGDRCKCKYCRHPSDTEPDESDSESEDETFGRPEFPPPTPSPVDSYYPKDPADASAVLEVLSTWLPPSSVSES